MRSPIEGRQYTRIATFHRRVGRFATADRQAGQAAAFLVAARADMMAAIADVLPLLSADERQEIAALAGGECDAARAA